MKTTQKQVSTPTQAWTRRAEREQTPERDYYTELNTWLLHAITAAEKNQTPNKEVQPITLLQDLSNSPTTIKQWKRQGEKK